MALFFWDASGLAKRFAAEIGSDVVNALFAGVAPADMATTVWGYAETFSILVRRLNGGVIDSESFTESASALQDEVIDNPDFGLLPVDDDTVLSSPDLIKRHSLNSTDAAILAMLLQYCRERPAESASCVVIAADKRFLRAAGAEGLMSLNPELVAAVDIPAWLASLGGSDGPQSG